MKKGYPSSLGYALAQTVVKNRTRFLTWLFTARHYEASIDPFALVRIDPRMVERGLTLDAEREFRFSNAIPEVIGGNWDVQANSFQEYYMYKSFERHFQHHIPWEETILWDRVINQIENGRTKWGCDSTASLRERLATIDRLYHSIAKEGYKTQQELRKDISTDPAIRDIHRYWPPELHEVCVNIGRHGEFIFQDGRHRLIIAQLLDLPQIPVRIKTRHARWQAKREASLTKPVEHESHPDILNANK